MADREAANSIKWKRREPITSWLFEMVRRIVIGWFNLRRWPISAISVVSSKMDPNVSGCDSELVSYFVRFWITKGEFQTKIIICKNVESESRAGVMIRYHEIVHKSEYPANRVGDNAAQNDERLLHYGDWIFKSLDRALSNCRWNFARELSSRLSINTNYVHITKHECYNFSHNVT